MADVKKAGLLGAAMVGGVSVAASAQEFMTQDEIAAMVDAMQVAGGNSGGSVSVGGGGGGGGTVASGDVTGGGDMQIGGTTGTAIADASGGNNNIAFVS